MKHILNLVAFAIVLSVFMPPRCGLAKPDETAEILSQLKSMSFILTGVAKMQEKDLEPIARDIDFHIKDFTIEHSGNLVTAYFDCKDQYGYTPIKGFLKIQMAEDAEKISHIEGHIVEISSDITFEFDFAFKDLTMLREVKNYRLFQTDLKKQNHELVKFNVSYKRYWPVFDANGKVVEREYDCSGRMLEYMLGDIGTRGKNLLSKDNKPIYDGLYLDMKFNELPDKGTRVRLIDDNQKVFTIKNPWPDNIDIPPQVKFMITRIDWKKLDIEDPARLNASTPLVLKYNLTAKISDKKGAELWKQQVEDAGSEILAHSSRCRIDRDRITFFEPLQDFLHRIPTNIIEVLVDQHFFERRFDDLPDEIILSIDAELIELYSMTGTPRKKHAIDLKEAGVTSARYVFGWEMDLEGETYLMGKDGKPTSWEDHVEIYMTVTKLLAWAFGVEFAVDVVDVAMEVVDIVGHAIKDEPLGLGEGVCDVLISALPAPLEFVTAGPEVYRVQKEKDLCLAPEHQQKWIKASLNRRGYTPIKKFRASRDLPLWVNLKTEKLAFMDQTGIVHKVKKPRGFNIALPYFEIYKAHPESGHFLVYPRGIHQNRPEWEWKELGHGKKYLIVPPAKRHVPTTISLVWKRIPGLDHPELAEGLYLKTAREGTIYLDSKAMVDFGWMDDTSKNLVLKKPYICLIRGRLQVKNVQDRIGIDFFELRDGKDVVSFVPRAWIQPNGTSYTVDYDPNSAQFTVAVEEGSVQILSHNEKPIATVDAGAQKTISLPQSPEEQPPDTKHREPKKDPETKEQKPDEELDREPQKGGQLIFSDTFDSDNNGKGNLHYRGFKKWYVVRGQVDLVGNGFHEHWPDKGLYVNLNGSSLRGFKKEPGRLSSQKDLALSPGKYMLKFRIACVPQIKSGLVDVSLAFAYQKKWTVTDENRPKGFTDIEVPIEISEPTTGRLTFSYFGTKTGAILLDDIQLLKIE